MTAHKLNDEKNHKVIYEAMKMFELMGGLNKKMLMMRFHLHSATFQLNYATVQLKITFLSFFVVVVARNHFSTKCE